MICERWGTCIGECLREDRPSACKNHLNNLTRCILSCDSRSKITCRDHGKAYTMLNTRNNKAINYLMDGGVIKLDKSVPEGVKKCDNVIILDGSDKIAVLVELKGEQVSDGISQLYETYHRFRDVFSTCQRVYARCVTNRRITPNLTATPDYKKLITAIGKRGNYQSFRVGQEEADISLGTSRTV